MNNNIYGLLSNINQKEVDDFVGKTKSSLIAVKESKNVNADLTWIDKIEEVLPNIDYIIRNPRRFLTQEEEVVIVEKTRKVTQESVKHLAQHTNYIQDYNTKTGDVLPQKLLNTYKEETFDIYENRFIHSLIKKLYSFIQRQLDIKEFETYSSQKKNVGYVGNTTRGNEKVDFEVKLKYSNITNELKTEEEKKIIKQRIENIANTIIGYNNSPFIKSLVHVVPVRSPIRKTNAILKDSNLKNCVELWEYLERYELSDPVIVEEKKEDLSTDRARNDFDLSYYLNYNILNSLGKDVKASENDTLYYLKKLINEYVKNNNNTSYEKFKQLILNEFKKSLKEKQTFEKKINKIIELYYNSYNKNVQRSLKYLN